MGVIHLAVGSEPIENHFTVLSLPPTGPSVAPNHVLPFGYQPADPAAYTARIINDFNDRLDGRMDRQCCPIDGGSA